MFSTFTCLHLSLALEGHWGTTDDFTTSFLHFSLVLYGPLGLGELEARPFPDVVFPRLFLSASSSFPFSVSSKVVLARPDQLET